MITIKKSELVEFKNLLERLSSNKDAFKNPDVSIQNDRLISIMNQVDSLITGYLKSELFYFSKSLLVHQMASQAAFFHDMDTVEDFIAYLKSASNKDLLDMYLTSIIECTSEDSIETLYKNIEEDDYLSSININPDDIIEFIDEFEHLKDRLVSFFERVNDQLFAPFKSEIMAIQAEESMKFERLYEKDPEHFIKLFFKVNVNEVLSGQCRADFYVSVTYPLNISYTMVKNHPEMIYVIFGFSVAEKFKVANSEAILKLLGEATKMKIVKLLSKRSMYQSEIAHAVELNRATVGHHIMQLAEAGIIQVAYNKGNRAYYELNIQRITEGFNQFVESLIGGKVDE